MSENGWIAVDLDGTLAEYHGWQGIEHVGNPIAPMVERVKQWLSEGRDVRIFTARIAGESHQEVMLVRKYINSWAKKHLGQEIPITNVKDYQMDVLYDDRCRQVEFNTGRLMAPEPKGEKTP